MSQVYKLKEPINLGSQSITELTFRKPKAKDFRSLPAEKMAMGHMLDLAGRLCAQPSQVIDELGTDDMREVLELVGNFMMGSQAIGTKP